MHLQLHSRSQWCLQPPALYNVYRRSVSIVCTWLTAANFPMTGLQGYQGGGRTHLRSRRAGIPHPCSCWAGTCHHHCPLLATSRGAGGGCAQGGREAAPAAAGAPLQGHLMQMPAQPASHARRPLKDGPSRYGGCTCCMCHGACWCWGGCQAMRSHWGLCMWGVHGDCVLAHARCLVEAPEK
jgi:hypothetical protein